jgi:DNA-binding CsgD family transcriptional regulator
MAVSDRARLGSEGSQPLSTGTVTLDALIHPSAELRNDHAEVATDTQIGPPRKVPFVGRREQLETLVNAWQRCRATGDSAIAVISGEAGIGKSTLMRQFRRMIPDAHCLLGRCQDFGDAPSYAPFVGILRDLTRGDGLVALRSELQPSVVEALAWLLPEFDEPTTPSSGTRMRMFGALLSLLEHLARKRQVLLIVEDVHWADESTWDLLVYLATNASGSPILFLVTHRDLAMRHPLRNRMAGLSRDHRVLALSLTGLRRADVTVQATALTGAPPEREQLEELMRLTNGNPLYVEAAAYLLEHPDSVDGTRDMLLAPLAELPGDTVLVLNVLSVGGTEVQHAALAEVSGLPESEIEAALRPAFDRRVLVATRDGYRFRHDLIREAVYEELVLPGERIRLHRSFAQAISMNPALAPPVMCHATGEVARHWTAAGEPVRALAATWQAAQEGKNLLAHPERLRMLQHILDLWSLIREPQNIVPVSRSAVLREAVEAAEASGECKLGLELSEQALSEYGAGEEALCSPLEAEIREYRAQMLAQIGRQGAREELERAIELVPADSRLRIRLMSQLAHQLRVTGDFRRADEIASQGTSLAEKIGDRLAGLCASLAVTALSFDVDAITDAAQIRRDAETLQDVALAAHAALVEGQLMMAGGRPEEAAEVARRGLQHASHAGLHRTLGARLAYLLGSALAAVGNWEVAEEVHEHALSLFPPPSYACRLLAGRGQLQVRMGQVALASDTLASIDAVRGSAESWADLETQIAESSFRVALLAAHGDDQAAVEAGHLCLSMLTAERLPAAARQLLVEVANALRRSEASAATESARLVRSDARAFLLRVDGGIPWRGVEGQAWRVSLKAALSDKAARSDALETQLDAWEKCPRPWPLAWALIDSAYALLPSGHRLEAGTRLQRAISIGADIGSAPIENAARAAFARARLIPTGRLSDPQAAKRQNTGSEHGLTSREFDVLAHLCEGRSNRQIGEMLFISVKTVSIHVSRIIAKLSVTSRGEAAAEAVRRRLCISPAASASAGSLV